MNESTALLVAQALNGAFALIAAWRRKGMTEAEIAERLNRVDAGGEAVTAEEVIASEDAWQAAIDEGRTIE